ncbi:MAG: 4Fe-4S dicluster domain-containing protein [Verrucomicrobiae bacterium]|nr:4Fe-4S dicluster domain-containing protein [Verrucomicrobiae bacterium]
MERQIRYQREARPAWGAEIAKLPGCERLYSCIQCGTCSGTCPMSLYMDYTPRRVIALIREGFYKDALSCRTIWLCASCYSCSSRCPQDIKVTDIMYALKREAIKRKVYPSRFPTPVLAREFYRLVKMFGRNSEFLLVFLLTLKTNPLGFLTMARTGIALLLTGRLSPKVEMIRDAARLRKALEPKEVA